MSGSETSLKGRDVAMRIHLTLDLWGETTETPEGRGLVIRAFEEPGMADTLSEAIYYYAYGTAAEEELDIGVNISSITEEER